MRVHDVERRVVELERVHVTGREPDVLGAPAPAELVRLDDDLVGPVDADHGSRRNPPREIDRDRARPTAHVEQVHAGLEPVQEVARRVLRGPPLVAAEHRLVMPVGVRLAHAPIITERTGNVG